jgi:flagella basal body P-ring formation protein FlgA
MRSAVLVLFFFAATAAAGVGDARRVPGAELRRGAVEFARGRVGPDARIEPGPPPADLEVPAAGALELRYELALPGEPRGDVAVRASAFVDGREAASAVVAMTVRVFAEVLVAARDLARGEPLGPDDFRRVTLETTRMRGRMLPAFLPDRTPRRALREGSVVLEEDLVPVVLVRRGELVTMRFRKGALRLAARGQARSDGARGAVIAVMNVDTKRVIQARVAGPQLVEVDP